MKKLVLLIIAAFSTHASYSQDDLLNSLDQDTVKKKEYVTATFKGTRLINLSTNEVMGKNILEFRIAHRFGDIGGAGGGAKNLFGLDGPVVLHLAFDYSLSDRLSLGIGRTNNGKLVDGNLKYKLLRQTKGNEMPLSVTYLGRVNVTHAQELFPGEYKNFLNRMSYVNQLIIARKFSSKLSLQLNPMVIHRNLVALRNDKNTLFAVGAAGRYKITKRLALTAEYVYRIGNYAVNQDMYTDHLAFGIDIETGGHVFQLFFSNSNTTNEAQFVPYTTQKWSLGQMRWGFNVSRVFTL